MVRRDGGGVFQTGVGILKTRNEKRRKKNVNLLSVDVVCIGCVPRQIGEISGDGLVVDVNGRHLDMRWSAAPLTRSSIFW